jgi:MFS family permease
MDYFPKRTLTVIGLLIYLIGGVGPVLANSFLQVMILRGVLGVGLGLIHALCSALVAENFEEPERSGVQGTMSGTQMLGCAALVFSGGWLASFQWNFVFLEYLLVLIPLVCVWLFVPVKKPIHHKKTEEEKKNAPRIKITPAAWGWIILMFAFCVEGQVCTNSLSTLLAERELGNSMQSGMAIAFLNIGGFIMGLLFFKLVKITKSKTYSVGAILLGISYLFMAFSGNMLLIYVGNLIAGIAFSILNPVTIVSAANTVDARSSGMAVSLSACAQNLAMFLSPLIINPFAQIIADSDGKGGLILPQSALLLGAALLFLIGIIMLFLKFKRDSNYYLTEH